MLPRVIIGSLVGAVLGGGLMLTMSKKAKVGATEAAVAVPIDSPPSSPSSKKLSSGGQDILAAFDSFSRLPEYEKLKQVFIEIEELEKSAYAEEKSKQLTSSRKMELKRLAARYTNKANEYFHVFVSKRKSGDALPMDLLEDITQAREYLAQRTHNIYQATSS